MKNDGLRPAAQCPLLDFVCLKQLQEGITVNRKP